MTSKVTHDSDGNEYCNEIFLSVTLTTGKTYAASLIIVDGDEEYDDDLAILNRALVVLHRHEGYGFVPVYNHRLDKTVSVRMNNVISLSIERWGA